MVGFQGASRGLIPDRKVLLDTARLHNTLELSWSISSHHFLRLLLQGIRFLQGLLPYHRCLRFMSHTSVTNHSLHNTLSHPCHTSHKIRVTESHRWWHALVIPVPGRKRRDGPRGSLARGLLSDLRGSERPWLKTQGGKPVRTQRINSGGRERKLTLTSCPLTF